MTLENWLKNKMFNYKNCKIKILMSHKKPTIWSVNSMGYNNNKSFRKTYFYPKYSQFKAYTRTRLSRSKWRNNQFTKNNSNNSLNSMSSHSPRCNNINSNSQWSWTATTKIKSSTSTLKGRSSRPTTASRRFRLCSHSKKSSNMFMSIRMRMKCSINSSLKWYTMIKINNNNKSIKSKIKINNSIWSKTNTRIYIRDQMDKFMKDICQCNKIISFKTIKTKISRIINNTIYDQFKLK